MKISDESYSLEDSFEEPDRLTRHEVEKLIRVANKGAQQHMAAMRLTHADLIRRHLFQTLAQIPAPYLDELEEYHPPQSKVSGEQGPCWGNILYCLSIPMSTNIKSSELNRPPMKPNRLPATVSFTPPPAELPIKKRPSGNYHHQYHRQHICNLSHIPPNSPLYRKCKPTRLSPPVPTFSTLKPTTKTDPFTLSPVTNNYPIVHQAKENPQQHLSLYNLVYKEDSTLPQKSTPRTKILNNHAKDLLDKEPEIVTPTSATILSTSMFFKQIQKPNLPEATITTEPINSSNNEIGSNRMLATTESTTISSVSNSTVQRKVETNILSSLRNNVTAKEDYTGKTTNITNDYSETTYGYDEDPSKLSTIYELQKAKEGSAPLLPTTFSKIQTEDLETGKTLPTTTANEPKLGLDFSLNFLTETSTEAAKSYEIINSQQPKEDLSSIINIPDLTTTEHFNINKFTEKLEQSTKEDIQQYNKPNKPIAETTTSFIKQAEISPDAELDEKPLIKIAEGMDLTEFIQLPELSDILETLDGPIIIKEIEEEYTKESVTDTATTSDYNLNPNTIFPTIDKEEAHKFTLEKSTPKTLFDSPKVKEDTEDNQSLAKLETTLQDKYDSLEMNQPVKYEISDELTERESQPTVIPTHPINDIQSRSSFKDTSTMYNLKEEIESTTMVPELRPFQIENEDTPSVTTLPILITTTEEAKSNAVTLQYGDKEETTQVHATTANEHARETLVEIETTTQLITNENITTEVWSKLQSTPLTPTTKFSQNIKMFENSSRAFPKPEDSTTNPEYAQKVDTELNIPESTHESPTNMLPLHTTPISDLKEDSFLETEHVTALVNGDQSTRETLDTETTRQTRSYLQITSSKLNPMNSLVNGDIRSKQFEKLQPKTSTISPPVSYTNDPFSLDAGINNKTRAMESAPSTAHVGNQVDYQEGVWKFTEEIDNSDNQNHYTDVNDKRVKRSLPNSTYSDKNGSSQKLSAATLLELLPMVGKAYKNNAFNKEDMKIIRSIYGDLRALPDEETLKALTETVDGILMGDEASRSVDSYNSDSTTTSSEENEFKREQMLRRTKKHLQTLSGLMRKLPNAGNEQDGHTRKIRSSGPKSFEKIDILKSLLANTEGNKPLTGVDEEDDDEDYYYEEEDDDDDEDYSLFHGYNFYEDDDKHPSFGELIKLAKKHRERKAMKS